MRLGPADDVAEITAVQVRRVVTDLIEMGRWHVGDRDILVVFDAGYDVPRMAHLFDGLPVEVLGRIRTDRVMRKPVPVPRISPPKHGKDFRFAKPETWGEPDAATVQVTGCSARHVRPTLSSRPWKAAWLEEPATRHPLPRRGGGFVPSGRARAVTGVIRRARRPLAVQCPGGSRRTARPSAAGHP